MLGDMTPCKILTGKKPDLSNVHPWGCKVHVHDTSGLKLDGHSRIGRWMGVKEETGDGHRVYWPERGTVTVERSVRFNFNDEVIVGVLPLEGEDRPATQIVEPAVKQIVKPQTIQPMEPATETPETVTVQPEEELG
jgi:hypothetical protein